MSTNPTWCNMRAKGPAIVLSANAMIRIPFHDLDPAGFVWHGRYFKYFDLARSALLDLIDYGYMEMKKSGFLWPIVDTSVRYLKPLMLNQDIHVTAGLMEWEFKLTIDYQIKDENGVLYTRARTVQVPIDGTTFEMKMGSPAVLLEKINHCLSVQPGKKER